MKILIIKRGALGDVVRTAYFAKALKERFNAHETLCRIYWLTADSALPLLRFNPFIDVLATDPTSFGKEHFDVVYSLDDELDTLEATRRYSRSRLVGAYLDSDNQTAYCRQSAPWFDMGLLSAYGKAEADRRKSANRLTHAMLFSGIFETAKPAPHFFNSPAKTRFFDRLCKTRAKGKLKIGINAFAGQRWRSKSLLEAEFIALLQRLCTAGFADAPAHIFLIGGAEDTERNKVAAKLSGFHQQISMIDTSADVLDLAALVHAMDLFISSDSLAMHLAIAQQIPTVCFFSPTSSAEIEEPAYVKKVVSTHRDYCNYRSDADNTTITADRLFSASQALVNNLPQRLTINAIETAEEAQ